MKFANKKMFSGLLEKAKLSKRKRIIYSLSEDGGMLSAMVNVILKNSYVCPHKHWLEDNGKIIKKAESYIVLEGVAKILIFDDTGKIIEKVLLSSDEQSMYLVGEGFRHSIISITEYCIIFENKNGPWEEGKDKVFHPKFPLEGDIGVSDVLQEWYGEYDKKVI